MEHKKAMLIMLVGLPGSGKTSFIKKFSNEELESFVTVSTDDYIQRKAEADGVTYDVAFEKYIKKATANMNAMVREAVNDYKNIIWDQTNLGVGSRKKKLKVVPKDIYFRKAIVFEVSDEILKERLESRAKRDGKTIPNHVIRQMKDSYVEPTLDEGFDEIIKV